MSRGGTFCCLLDHLNLVLFPKYSGLLTRQASSTSTSPESQMPLNLPRAGITPSANVASPSSSPASGSTNIPPSFFDIVDPTPRPNIGIPASAIAADATVRPAERTFGRISDSRISRWTSRADFGRRCNCRAGMRWEVRSADKGAGSVS